ncbi:glycoprotease [Spiroplasma sabaudiense Ar-1343]|uniref:Glycoprotease n=1 Tax=Spiroplasma sabaudiense Ar-1343 TaxID=1276257 RepID=W6AIL0_9MOLU|nr:tRNA (adenosine(37)-N6)-threonylcarbamoyltransferase complex dimerization subunit type 1 TsaB [Spiroplasma sabaudiense]AHI53544.1 glycoprotease [Spiroplasma sabaudiense Ar-1343]
MKLFIDTCNNNLILILFSDKKIVDKVVILQQNRISDIFKNHLQELLDRNSLQLKEISELYVTKGPGSYTGVRIGLTIAKTLFTISKTIAIYTISSLKFQAGLENVVSIIDARSNKSYLGIYQAGLIEIEDQLLPNETVEEIIKNFTNYKIVKDQVAIDYCKNLLDLLNSFDRVQESSELNPNYIKNFI